MTDRKFWQNLVPRVAMADDATWYAVIAVSTLFEHPISSSLRQKSLADEDMTKGWHRQALEWYGCSLRATAALSPSANSILTTFLYAALEMLQDRPNIGLKLICQSFWLNEATNPTGGADLDILDATLPMLNRALLPLSIFGCHLTPTQRQRARRPDCLKQSESVDATILNRMEELHDLIYDVQIFCNGLSCTGTPSEIAVTTQQDLIQSLHAWQDSVTLSGAFESTGELRRFLAQLLIIYETYYVKLCCIFEPSLDIFDQYEASFSIIVSEATRALSPVDPEDRVFSFEIAIVPCLYYTAWACRRPRIRRRAIELLRNQAPRQENLWTADSCLSVAEQVVVHEEGLTHYTPDVTVAQDQWLPPTHRRLPISAVGDPTRVVGESGREASHHAWNTFWNVGVVRDVLQPPSSTLVAGVASA